MITILALAVSVSVQARSLVSRYVAGQDYHVSQEPAPAMVQGQVRVTEFFLYSCPHCYHFEPRLNSWLGRHSEIAFSRVPVLFGQGGQPYARLYYTEVKLGVVGRLHDKIFDAIHQRGRVLTTQAAMRKFMVAHGVDSQRFDAAYDSASVKAQVRKVIERMRRYQVTAVPSLSVGGQYWVSGRSAGSNKRMLKVVDYLIGRTRREKTPDNQAS